MAGSLLAERGAFVVVAGLSFLARPSYAAARLGEPPAGVGLGVRVLMLLPVA